MISKAFNLLTFLLLLYLSEGGASLLVKYIGKDATNSFYGSLNNHTKSARQIMVDLAVAKVSSGSPDKKEQ
jgi:hypothetical protein